MSPAVAALIALAAAVMRNGSTGDVDAAAYTLLFWTWAIAAGLMLAF